MISGVAFLTLNVQKMNSIKCYFALCVCRVVAVDSFLVLCGYRYQSIALDGSYLLCVCLYTFSIAVSLCKLHLRHQIFAVNGRKFAVTRKKTKKQWKNNNQHNDEKNAKENYIYKNSMKPIQNEISFTSFIS